MGNANEDAVREGYDAFGNGDMETLGKLIAPDAVHVVAGNHPLAGEFKGQDAIFGMYGQLFEATDGTLKVELLEAKAEGDDKVVAKHRASATRGDKTLDDDATIVFTFDNGKIARLDETSDNQAASDAFWSD